eukprot:CAMPEP_0185841848 /NCGR_PEP_ID=MMETSP1353-20130828/18107_1 /TAXON_ID=1077150 /ORGANISM="Erythrolobus australicus, Strain CCMP3124" /LENGTH=97 /DNA_ID=CAMNT_0028541339 /DNA_START=2159 /DNA_END=2448 /DNA_ORIENTATION=+
MRESLKTPPKCNGVVAAVASMPVQRVSTAMVQMARYKALTVKHLIKLHTRGPERPHRTPNQRNRRHAERATFSSGVTAFALAQVEQRALLRPLIEPL